VAAAGLNVLSVWAAKVDAMNSIRIFTCAVALAIGAPLTALAQMGPGDGPPPQFVQIRDNAKTAAFNDLTPDHRAKVQAIADRAAGGSLDREDAAKQIDAILTPAEAQAVLGEQQKMRDAMRQAFASAGGNGGFGNREGYQRSGERRQPDAGRFLLMLSGAFHRGGPQGTPANPQ
jgi:hypothetical protein